MKNLVRILSVIVMTLFLTGGSLMADSLNLHDVLTNWETGRELLTSPSEIETAKGIYDSGASAVSVIDVTGSNDSVTAFLLFEITNLDRRTGNEFGIYDFKEINGNIIVKNTLKLFDGSDDARTTPKPSSTVAFKDGKAKVNDGEWQTFGTTFGFYIDTTIKTDNIGRVRFYSHASLNPDKFDHMMIFDTSASLLLDSNVIIGIEDLWKGGREGIDRDFNDMVVGMTNVKPVPEPATLILVGAGLIALVKTSRKKMRSVNG